MSDRIERLSHLRRILLIASAGSFLAWQVPMMDKSERLADSNAGLMALISAGGFFIWIAILIFLIGPWVRLSASRNVNEALNDELVRSNRTRAYTVGYMAMMLGSVAMFALSFFEPVKGVEAAHIILVIGVVAPIFSFAALERAG